MSQEQRSGDSVALSYDLRRERETRDERLELIKGGYILAASATIPQLSADLKALYAPVPGL